MRRLLLLLDPVVVIAFVVIGRDTHAEGNALGDVAVTAAPFVIALAAGWVVARAWKDPLSNMTGVVVAASTVAAGLALRRLMFGDGIALPFVLVATGFLTAAMLGWRAVVRVAAKRVATAVTTGGRG